MQIIFILNETEAAETWLKELKKKTKPPKSNLNLNISHYLLKDDGIFIALLREAIISLLIYMQSSLSKQSFCLTSRGVQGRYFSF